LTRKILYIIFIINFVITKQFDYLWPTNGSETVTAFFGEARPHRYHVGLDIRTYGINGKDVYAISDGYIYRIKISTDSYGSAIYLKHDDGNISLYAHLSKFNPTIQNIVENLQIQQNSYLIDHLIEPGLINVSKGDVIGYTGDTGGLSGPHLHFEIRDEINRPINPLMTNLRTTLIDNMKPIPTSIAFIPKTKTSQIEGLPFIKEYSLEELSPNKFYLNDTINIIGDFGMALNVFDKVDGQPFKFGIYSIELFIDSIYHYGIEYDKTSFDQSNQIYLERNYNILSKKNKEYYQLFKNKFQNNTFINKESKGSIQKESGTHNFKIIIKDVNQNQSEVIGNFRINDLIKLKYNIFELLNGGWKIEFKNINEIIDFEASIHKQSNEDNSPIICYKEAHERQPYIEIIDDKSIAIHNTNKVFNVLKIQLETDKGKTETKYILLDDLPINVQGEITVEHSYDNVFINFEENKFSGIRPILSYRKNGELYNDIMIRRNKNNLSSTSLNISDFLDMEDIAIKYNIKDYSLFKEIDVEKMITSPNQFSQKSFKNGQIVITHEKETFFDTTLIYLLDSKINDNKSIISPFYIGPSSIPFNKPLKISVNIFDNQDTDNLVLSAYDNSKSEWVPLKTQRKDSKIISSEIQGGTTIGILVDNKPPEINNVIPRNNATYDLSSLDDFEIFVKDNFSKINHENGIILKVNGKNLLTGFNLYQEKILITRVKDYLKMGQNNYHFIIWDNANNKKEIKGKFFIK